MSKPFVLSVLVLLVFSLVACGASSAKIELPAEIVTKFEERLSDSKGILGEVLWAERSNYYEADPDNPDKKRYKYCVIAIFDDDLDHKDSGYWVIYYIDGRTKYSPYYAGSGATAHSETSDRLEYWLEIGCTHPRDIPDNPFKW